MMRAVRNELGTLSRHPGDSRGAASATKTFPFPDLGFSLSTVKTSFQGKVHCMFVFNLRKE